MKTFRNPAQIHPPLAAYSHQIELTGRLRWLVLSGQVGQKADGSLPEDPVQQLQISLDNLLQNLTAAGMSLDDLVKLTIYAVGDLDLEQRRDVLASWLGEHRPCVTYLNITALATPDYRVEIDGWACADVDPSE